MGQILFFIICERSKSSTADFYDSAHNRLDDESDVNHISPKNLT